MSENICIICIDEGFEPLLQNNSCKCKYTKHITCWEKYSKTTTPLKCPMCRKVLNSKTQSANPSVIPYITPSAPVPYALVPSAPVPYALVPSAPVVEDNVYIIMPEIVISPSRQITNSYQIPVTIPNNQLQNRAVIQPNITVVPQQTILWENLTPDQKKQRIIKSILIGAVMGLIMFVILYFIL